MVRGPPVGFDRNGGRDEMKMLIAINETGMVFPSISAAARYAGVDPSNVGKVLRGSRSSAGGYTFSYANPEDLATGATGADVLRADIATARAETAKLRWSESRRRRESERRKKTAAAAEAKRRAARPSSELVQARQTVRAAMVSINSALNAGTKYSKQTQEDLQSLAEAIGSGKRRLFNTDAAHLRGKSETEINQILKRLQDIMQREAQHAQKKREEFNTTWSTNFTLQPGQNIDDYQDALKKYFEAIGKVREMMPRVNGRSGYGNIYTDLQQDLQYLTPEQVEDLADILERFAADQQNADADTLQMIYEDWREEALDGIEEDEEEYQDFGAGWGWDDQ